MALYDQPPTPDREKEREHLVDFPHYQNDLRVAFPPGEETGYGRPMPPKTPPEATQRPYAEAYPVDPPAPDPSQTRPGAPDIRDIDTPPPPDAQLPGLSPDVSLKD